MSILVTTGFTKGRKATKSSAAFTTFYRKDTAIGVHRKRVKSYPMALSGCFSSVAEGRLIVGGGAGNTATKTYRNVHQYDSTADTWKPLPNMNVPRSYASSCYAEKTLFVMGGKDGGDNALDSVECIKIDATSQSPRWTICQTPLPLTLQGHVSIAINGDIYLTGGTDSSQGFRGKINGEANDISWTPLPTMLRTRVAHIAFPHQNKLVVVGGLGESANTCESYDPQTNQWTLMSHKFPCKELYGACATFDGDKKVIIVGGYRDWKLSSKVTTFDHQNGFKDIANFKIYGEIAFHAALSVM